MHAYMCNFTLHAHVVYWTQYPATDCTRGADPPWTACRVCTYVHVDTHPAHSTSLQTREGSGRNLQHMCRCWNSAHYLKTEGNQANKPLIVHTEHAVQTVCLECICAHAGTLVCQWGNSHNSYWQCSPVNIAGQWQVSLKQLPPLKQEPFPQTSPSDYWKG